MVDAQYTCPTRVFLRVASRLAPSIWLGFLLLYVAHSFKCYCQWTVDPQFRQGTLTLKGVDIPQFLSLAGGSHEKLVVGSPNKAVSWYLENCGPFGSSCVFFSFAIVLRNKKNYSDGYFTFSMSVRVPNVKFPLALTLNRNSNAVRSFQMCFFLSFK